MTRAAPYARPAPAGGRPAGAPCARARRIPRRARRGFAALGLALIALAALSAALLAWRAGEARIRLAGEARVVAAAAAARGYALHHWLHEARSGPAFAAPAPGDARALTPAEAAALAAHPASAPWALLPRGWEADAFVAREAGGAGDLPRGAIALRAPADAPGELVAQVRGRLGAGLADALPSARARAALALDGDRDTVVFASAFARLDGRAVLRAPRAGHPAPRMAADLDMGGGAVAGADPDPAAPPALAAAEAAIGILCPPDADPGPCERQARAPGAVLAVAGAVEAASLAAADGAAVEFLGPLAAAGRRVGANGQVVPPGEQGEGAPPGAPRTVGGGVRAASLAVGARGASAGGDVAVAGTLAPRGRLAACRTDPDGGGGCLGGGLDLSAAAGAPDWTQAAVAGRAALGRLGSAAGTARVEAAGQAAFGALRVGACAGCAP